MKFEDLMGFLRVFEMTLKQRKREKSIALKTVHEEEDSSEEDNADELALLTKKFKNFFKKVPSHLRLVRHSPICLKGKNPLETQIFLTIR